MIILSKDADFHQLSFTLGHPPKVIWVRCGNCSTHEIEQMIRSAHRDLLEFEANPDASFLTLE
jgi:predicted nuclease of predicted toxin-antitoxin system